MLPFRDARVRTALLEPLDRACGPVLQAGVDGDQALTAMIEARRPGRAKAATGAARAGFAVRCQGNISFRAAVARPPDPCGPADGQPERAAERTAVDNQWNGANAAQTLPFDSSGATVHSVRMARRMLPVGMTSLRKIRGMDCYYVDKTDHLRRLVEGGQYYFLSRPRRFGKTLLVDTLQELFEGSEELFRGLTVHGKWDWSARHPVVRLDFSGVGDFDTPDGVRGTVEAQLEEAEMQAGLEPGPAGAAVRFRRLIMALHERTGRQVVVLVDEYDKPILDALGDRELARANRDFLRSLYGVIKACDKRLRFVFLTGVSKLAGLFSGLNNLNDITLDGRYGDVCGYTDAELDAVFAPELEGLDREKIRRWYNGYNWLGPEKVYNPFDILLLFDKREFKAHWFRSGTPTFLVDLLSRRRVETPTLERMVADDDLLSTFDIDDISTEALLFQTGYLTIVGEETADGLYRLDYPNREVKHSLNRRLLRAMAPATGQEATRQAELARLTAEDDLEKVKALFEAFFASVPHDWHRKNDLANYEGYWAALVYSHFAAAGLDVRVEEATARGRLDMAVLSPGCVHVYEFKVVDRGPEGRALAQIRERGYADKYRHLGVPIRLIGMEFGREERNIVGFEFETA